MTGRLFACRRRQAALAGVLATGIAFAVATLARRGLSGDGVAWGLVQLTLAGVAAYDLATRRIRNLVTLPGSLLAILLRAAFERAALVEVLLAGLVVFLAFFTLALLLRSGFGMGDAKFAAMLGFVLGSAVVPALLIGTVAGGVMGVGVLAWSRTKGATIAYGPYLAFGAAVAILVFSTPPLV